MSKDRLLVTDTHPIVYFFCDGGKRLSKKARRAFEEATKDAHTSILVPTPVLWELSLLVQNGDIEIRMPFSEWVDKLFQYRTINPLAFDETTVKILHDVRYHTDPFDRAIVATSIQIGLPLITNDGMMHRNNPCELYWD